MSAVTLHWQFENTYAQLPALLFSKCAPTAVRAPTLVKFNHGFATALGLLDESTQADAIERMPQAHEFAGNALPAGAEPLAQAYAGHQFGGFSVLGDGRAVLLGEHITPSGQRVDIQLKGSGPTPYSRRGDGRAALGPMLREYLISEVMHALNIPTTRALAVVSTGEPVFRQTTEPGGVLTRVAASHVRVGTFQYAAARQQIDSLQALVDYVANRHYPAIKETDNPALALLDKVVDVQVDLLVHWMRVGFIHGVMNTDNMSISGETIDYGPCAFMDSYDPGTVFSSIDEQGRYAFSRQPGMAQWNLLRFAEALLPLLDEDEARAIEKAKASIGVFASLYEQRWFDMMSHKLGLSERAPPDARARDRVLVDGLLAWMQVNKADYTNTFRDLSQVSLSLSGLYSDAGFVQWYEQWQARLTEQQDQSLLTKEASVSLMQRMNPAYIARNHLVEEALEAGSQGDLTLFDELLTVLADPYTQRPGLSHYERPDQSGHPYKTFCGT
jgi:uncharacterized protein YdiU (UPF0061 family)